MNRSLLMMIFVTAFGGVFAQNRGNIGQPGAGASAPIFDSLGISIPYGEVVIGTGSKAPGSSDSLYWSAGLVVDAPVIFSGLANLTESAGDSVLLINTSGSIFKSVLGKNFFTSDGTATGHRTHDFDNFNLQISDIANFTITANTNWQFGTTANDINISAITGLGMSIATTGGSNFISVSSGNFIDLSAPDIILDAPDIILEDPLTLSTWDSVLVRHPTTGEIQARLASTIGGSGADSMGLVMPTGYILMGQGNALPDTSALLFWDNTNTALVIDKDAAATGSFSWIRDASTTGLKIEKTGTAGAIIDFNPKTLDGTSSTSFRFFRETNTSGAVFFDILKGDNTNTTNARIAGNAGANTFLAANNGRVGIGTSSPNASAILDVSSTTGALIVPRMTSTQRDALTAAAGMIIYNTTTSKLQVYTTSWTDLH